MIKYRRSLTAEHQRTTADSILMEDHSSDSIKNSIRKSGLRATPARIATLRLLLDSTSPLTHAEVATELEGSGVDKA
ncbi:MAG: hypothetical protein VX438_19220, partial [Planctomycetota bacterium]|nr:hypothetical protein [Planctomycetota bacterium]